MTNLLQNLEFCNSIDSRLRVLENKKPMYELPKGIKAATWYNQPNQNPNSLTSTQYQLYLNENQIVSDYFIEEVDVSVTINITENNTNNNTRPFATGNLAPRFMPLTNASQSIQIVINGQPIQVNPQNMLEVICAFNKDPAYNGIDLPCCSTLDVFTDLNPAAAQFALQTGSFNNPLNNYFSSTYGSQPRFGSVQVVSLDNTAMPQNATTARVFRFIVREPVFTGVTSMTLEQSGGFLSSTNVQITRNWVSNLATQLVNFFPVAANLAYASSSAVINSAKIYYQVYTPDDAVVLPPITYYPIVDYGIQSQTATTVATGAGAPVTINSQTMSLNVVPRCIYVWVAVPDANRTPASSQAPGFQITNLQVSFNGVGGQFSSMTSPIEIYDEFMGRQGCIKTFQETGYTTAIQAQNAGALNLGLWGTCLRIDSSVLAGIDWEKYSVGSQFNANLQIQVTATNLSAGNQTPSLFIQVVNDSLLEINGPNSALLLKTILDVPEVMDVRATKPIEFTHHPMMGGSFFGKIGSFFKNAYNKVLKPVGKFVYNHRDQIIPVAQKVAKYAGLGKHRKSHKSRKSHKRGSALVAEGLRRKHRRHHYRGGALAEDSDSHSCDSQCSCEDYSDTESYTSTESEGEQRGGRLISKSQLQKRLKY